jgi:hypothetical protein
MKKKFLLFFMLLAILEGCVTSLHPLYTSRDLVYDTRLLGTWNSDGGRQTWKLENMMDHQLAGITDPVERQKQESFKGTMVDKRSYLLTYTEDGHSAEFLANLVQLDGHQFMDIFPLSAKMSVQFLEDHYLPTHTYAKVEIAANKASLYFFNAQKLYELMDQNRIRLKHESFEYYKVITASTEELQAFVKKFADHKDMFENALVLKR